MFRSRGGGGLDVGMEIISELLRGEQREDLSTRCWGKGQKEQEMLPRFLAWTTG